MFVPALVILALIGGAAPLAAHHSWPVSQQRLVTVKGTVIDFAWENPHPMITLEVPTDDGRTEKWKVGGPAIYRMTANGWNKMTVQKLSSRQSLQPRGDGSWTPSIISSSESCAI